jgi:hypothetical protein
MRQSRHQSAETSHVTKPETLFKKAKNQFTRIRKNIVRELNRYKGTGKQIAVTAYALGEGKIPSYVEDIYKSGNDEIVVLKWFDRNNLASLTHIFMEEILSIHPLEKGRPV